MPTYETLFITQPSLTDEEEHSTVAGLAQVIADGGGDLVASDRMGRRRLAYPIRKFEDGVYTRFLYDAEPAVPRELERRTRLNDKVLRFLTVRLEDDWAAAAKQQAVRDAKARAEAEVARAAAEAAGEAAGGTAPTEGPGNEGPARSGGASREKGSSAAERPGEGPEEGEA